MLVEAVIQCVGQMLIELAIREVAVPAAKKLAQNTQAQRQACGAAILIDADDVMSAPLLSKVRVVQVVSSIPGRLRLDVAGLTGKPELARKLDQEIAALGGVTQAAASSRTGRMLIQYEPELQTADALLTAVDRARATHLSAASSGTRHLAAVV
jgi:hypothetical protein